MLKKLQRRLKKEGMLNGWVTVRQNLCPIPGTSKNLIWTSKSQGQAHFRGTSTLPKDKHNSEGQAHFPLPTNNKTREN